MERNAESLMGDIPERLAGNYLSVLGVSPCKARASISFAVQSLQIKAHSSETSPSLRSRPTEPA